MRGTYGTAAWGGSPFICNPCGYGLFSNLSGSTMCQRCIPGTYANITTSSSCTNCASGTFSTVIAATSVSICNACPPNSYSPEGGTLCVTNPGFYDMGVALIAYYPFRPQNYLLDATGISGPLTASPIKPMLFSYGPFGIR